MKTYMAIFLAIIFVAVGVAGFAFGVNVGGEIRSNKYDLILNAEDTEILFQTLDELVSRQVVREQ